MAAGEYLKLAAANLRRAALTMQQNIADLRHDLTHSEQSIRQQIDEMNRRINDHNQQMARADKSDESRAEHLRENMHLDSEIVNRKHELNRYREQIQQQIINQQREIEGLNSQASQLEQRAGSV